jgi:hypothetical protein
MDQCHQSVNNKVPTITQPTATSAKKLSQPSGAERRTGPRFGCCIEAVCRVGGPGKTLPARVIDISAGGIGLILKERFQEGDQITVRLLTTAVSKPLPVHVVHVAEVAPDFYLLGGAFTTPFSPSELHQLVS